MERKDQARREYLLGHLREICLELPEVAETLKWNNPTFVAGKKMFAVLDRYNGSWCIAFRAKPDQGARLIARPGFFPAPYSARYGWICMDAEGKMNWREVEGFLIDSYRSVALKRMLAVLE